MNPWNFEKQVIVITGGTGGIGRHLTKAFLQCGGKVYLSAKQQHELDTLVEELNQLGIVSSCQATVLDISHISDLQNWLAHIIEQEQRIDVFIHAAAICPLDDVFEVTEMLWDSVMDINLKAAFFAMQSVMKQMQRQGSGRIVNIGSTSAYNGGIVTTPAYGASKAALHTLTKWFASKFSQYGVTVNAVVPGPTKTKMIADFSEAVVQRFIDNTPDKRLGETIDVVQAIMFLAARETTHITGAMLDVCGGQYLR